MFRAPDSGIADDVNAPGFHMPPPLDFHSAPHAKGSAAYTDWVTGYAREVRDKALELTDLGGSLSWTTQLEKGGIKCESLELAGTKVLGIRHIAQFDGLTADVVLDAYCRLNYTDIIDKFTTHVSVVESLPCPEDFAWMQAVWTYDRIFPVGASRDFVTLDYIDKMNYMLVSKSVEHPGLPRTAQPTWGKICSGNLDAPTYRVPLLYGLKVIPDPGDAKSCKIVQFQWSDIAGIVPQDKIHTSVIDFGFDSITKFRDRLMRLPPGCSLGAKSGQAFLADPLVPRWRQSPQEMIPGMQAEARRGCFS